MGDGEFAVHPNPVWRDRADFIIHAEVGGRDPARRFEQLWTRRVGPNRFEICCIPFFAYDLALGDEVETAARSGRQFLLSRVIIPSGHYTFRVWFGESSHPSSRDEVVRELARLGCELEWSSENLVAVDAPSVEVAQGAADLLLDHERQGHLVYETGRTL